MAQTTGEEEFPRIRDDNCCMCGLGVIRLQTHLPEAHVLYASFTNEVRHPLKELTSSSWS